MCRGRSRPIRDFRRRTVPGFMCLELGKATLLHPLPVPSRLPGEPGCSSTMHGPATALHIYVCTLEEGLPVLWGCRVLPLLASAPEEGGESALKPPQTHCETPPLRSQTRSSRPSAQGSPGDGGDASPVRSAPRWEGLQSNGTFLFFPPNQQRLLEDQQQKKNALKTPPIKENWVCRDFPRSQGRAPTLPDKRDAARASREARSSRLGVQPSSPLTTGPTEGCGVKARQQRGVT